ncbi:hypothetical protein P4B35_10180 [Pontiellaceae bacterium B12227]|nr:hypothetical protein [Pontiellaceae bacterium B12227]
MHFSILDILVPSIEMTAVYGFAALAILVAFRIANFPDLTIDGSCALGGAICSMALMHGYPPVLSVALCMLGGVGAGAFTVLLHTRLGISRLLSGIITTTLLYTLNLRIMGRSNTPLGDLPGFFEFFAAEGLNIALGFVFLVVASLLLLLFLRSNLGYFLRAAGENPKVVVRRGLSEESLMLVSLPLANALSALSGGLIAQQQGFADIGMGTGLVIMSLAALLLGEAILPPSSLQRLVLAGLLGMFLYQILTTICLRMGLNPWDLKLASGILLIAVLAAKRHLLAHRASANIGADPL